MGLVDSSAPFDELATAALAIPITLSATAVNRCKIYVEVLQLWRRRLSLTAAESPREIVLDHILDSLYVAPFINGAVCRVADVGSGAGFPGVPLAIARPEASFVLIESRRKKANFLREVIRQTNLVNVVVAEKRATELRTDAAHSFDVVVSRAVGSLHTILELSAALVKRDGVVIAMKGPSGRSESAAHPGFDMAEIVEYDLPSGARHLLLVCRRR